ncbi:restriction endonuclease [Lysobacter spongiae]|uniref:Restriction endonuclease n=1 Tax=Marilutibacter spongiae TaxID=2025720 RepID=A0A7W3TJB1_9GAMM|nr:restriction endonuclease [Lysobacter spongiae]
MITLGVTLTLGAALTLYCWHVRRKQHETRQGLVTLAGMRWREFSNFVVEALHAQGFETDPQQTSPQSGQKSDVRLIRDGRTWLLSCKQGVKYRIDAAQVDSLAGSVNFHGAGGGIIATLGHVQADARRNSHGLELLDGRAVWALVEHLLPNGLHQSVAHHARRRTLLEIGLAWLLAVLLGVGAAFMLAPGEAPVQPPPAPTAASGDAETPPAPAPVQQTEPDNAASPSPPPPASPAAGDEASQREQIVSRINALPDVQRAAWSTRSTLLVGMAEGAVDGPEFVRPICDILGEYPDLRASRVQLQPLDGGTQSVRFMQCHQY